ncbi:MAG: hypothetical protein WBB15_10385, partial [Ornithinimicrobium sp.]
IQDGTKLKGISDLEGSTSAEAPSTVGSSADSIWEVASLVVDGVTGILGGAAWAFTVDESADKSALVDNVAAWLNWISWADDTARAISQPGSFSNSNALDTVDTIGRLLTASFDVYLTADPARNPGAGWSEKNPTLTDQDEFINILLSLLSLIYDTYETSTDDANQWGITYAVGQDIFDMQVVAQFVYNLLDLKDSGAIEYFGPFVAMSPAALMLPILAVLKDGDSATDPDDPADPTNPSDPDPDPDNPTEPSKPTDPSDPTSPTRPTGPKDPSKPAAPTSPGDPSTPGGPGGRSGSYPPANPADGVPGRVTYTG